MLILSLVDQILRWRSEFLCGVKALHVSGCPGAASGVLDWPRIISSGTVLVPTSSTATSRPIETARVRGKFFKSNQYHFRRGQTQLYTSHSAATVIRTVAPK
jgi:hypothetical protein